MNDFVNLIKDEVIKSPFYIVKGTNIGIGDYCFINFDCIF